MATFEDLLNQGQDLQPEGMTPPESISDEGGSGFGSLLSSGKKIDLQEEQPDTDDEPLYFTGNSLSADPEQNNEKNTQALINAEIYGVSPSRAMLLENTIGKRKQTDPQSRNTDLLLRKAINDKIVSGPIDPKSSISTIRTERERLQKLQRDYPGSTKAMLNGSVGADTYNEQELTGIEKTFKEYAVDSAMVVARFAPRTVVQLAKFANEGTAFAAGVLDSAAGTVETVTGLQSGGGFTWLRDWAQMNARQQGKQIQEGTFIGTPEDIRGKRLWDNPELILDPEWVLTNLGDTAASLLPTIAATYATGGSYLAGGLIGGVMEGGGLYSELLDPDLGQPVSDTVALNSALIYGTASGWLNKIGLEAILGKKAVQKITRRITRSLVAGGTEAVTEWAEEPTGALVEALAREGVPTDTKEVKDVLSKVAEGATNIDVMVGSFLLGGGGSYISQRVAIEQNKAQTAKRDSQMFDLINEMAGASTLKSSSPADYQKAFETIKNEAGIKVESVFVPVDSLVEAVPDESQREKLLADMQIKGLFDEALESPERTVAIPISTYAAHIAGTDLATQLKPDIKFRVNGVSEKEGGKIDAIAKNVLEKTAPRLRDDVKGQGAIIIGVNENEEGEITGYTMASLESGEVFETGPDPTQEEILLKTGQMPQIDVDVDKLIETGQIEGISDLDKKALNMVESDPTFAFKAAVRKSGIALKSLSVDFDIATRKQIMSKMPGAISKTGKIQYDELTDLAREFGLNYESADDAIKALSETSTKKDALEKARREIEGEETYWTRKGQELVERQATEAEHEQVQVDENNDQVAEVADTIAQSVDEGKTTPIQTESEHDDIGFESQSVIAADELNRIQDEIISTGKRVDFSSTEFVNLIQAVTVDRVSGFKNAIQGSAKYDTVKRAQKFVTENPEYNAHYVEIDLKNLGGKNNAMGHQKANLVYRKIADIIKARMDDVDGFVDHMRHGGDELALVIISKDSLEEIQSILIEAQIDVEEFALNTTVEGTDVSLMAIAHPKHPSDLTKRGIGFTIGIEGIEPDLDIDKEIISSADTELEGRKKGFDHEYSEQVKEARLKRLGREDFSDIPETALGLEGKVSRGESKELVQPADQLAGPLSTANDLRSAVDQSITSKGRDNLDVEVVQSTTDLEEDLDYSISIDNTVEGAFDPNTGKIYLVADNISADQAWAKLLHEGTHKVRAEKGWSGVFGKQAKKIMSYIDAKIEAGDQAWKTAEDKAVKANTPDSKLREETITYFLADNTNKTEGLWKRIVAAIREWAIRNGFKKKNITDQDIVNLAEVAVRRAAMKRGVSVADEGVMFSKKQGLKPVDTSLSRKGEEVLFSRKMPEATKHKLQLRAETVKEIKTLAEQARAAKDAGDGKLASSLRLKLVDLIGKAKSEAATAYMGTLTERERIKRRRQSISDIREYFGLTDNDLKKISRKDVRLMSKYEFKKYKDDIQQKALEYADTRQAKLELLNTIHELNLQKVDNFRDALSLPPIRDMNIKQLQDFERILSEFHEGDSFLNKRQIETVDHTFLKGIRTWREAKEKLAAESGVTIEELDKVKVTGADNFKWDNSLYESNPFYRVLVTRVTSSLLDAQMKAHEIESKVYDLAEKAQKSVKRSLMDRVIPNDKQIFDYLEANKANKEALAEQMTSEQLDLAHYMQEYFAQALTYLMETKSLSRGRENYFVHMRRTLLESIRDDGLMTGVKEMFKNYEQDQMGFNILDDNTGNILPLEKFFQFSLQRSGELTPTKNIVRAFLTYVNTFEKKVALDGIMPAMSIYAQSLTPTIYTQKGLEIDQSVKKFVNKWINNKKGRRISYDSVIKQGGKLDLIMNSTRMFVSMLKLGFNPIAQTAAPIGEQSANFIMMGVANQAKGTARMATKKGKRIVAKYEAVVGRTLFETLTAPGEELTSRFTSLMFAGFHAGSRIANAQYLLGMMTDTEYKAEEISTERLTSMELEKGRFRAVPGSASLVGSTSPGKLGTQFKSWAIPVIRTTLKDLQKVAKDIKNKPFGEKLTSRESAELLRITFATGMILAVAGIYQADDDDDSLISKLITRALSEASLIYSAFDVRWMLFTTPPAIKWAQDLGMIMADMLQLVEYKDGSGLKGPRRIVSHFTPGFVKSLRKKKKKQY